MQAMVFRTICVFLLGTAGLAWPGQDASAQDTAPDGRLYHPALRLRPEFMPQVATRIDLDLLKTNKGILQCDANLRTCVVRGLPQPLLKQSGPEIDKIDPTLREQQEGGCYATSIVTIMHAALKNRAVAINPKRGLTDEFYKGQELKPDGFAQLVEHYQAAKAGRAYYFYDLVQDVAAGSIFERCNPGMLWDCDKQGGHVIARNGDAWAMRKTPRIGPVPKFPVYKLVNDDFIALLKQGVYPLIGYHYYLPKKFTYDAKSNELLIELHKGSQHKVAVTGFSFEPTPGRPTADYPLVIDNPGNGARVAARLSPNPNDAKGTLTEAQWIELASPDLKAQMLTDDQIAKAIKTAKFVFRPENLQGQPDWLAGRPIVIYNETKPKAKFFALNYIEQVDMLYVRAEGEPKLDPRALPPNIANLPPRLPTRQASE